MDLLRGHRELSALDRANSAPSPGKRLGIYARPVTPIRSRLSHLYSLLQRSDHLGRLLACPRQEHVPLSRSTRQADEQSTRGAKPGGSNVSRQSIATSRLAELEWKPSVNPAHIGVTADRGGVPLTGHVQDYMQKHAAETAASLVEGVKAVAEELEVKLTYEAKRSDEEIAAAAVDRLGWDVSVPRDAVKVRVEHGWVTLISEVGWCFQGQAAEQAVKHMLGVVGVSNATTIKPTVNTATLSDDITHALHRSWFFDPQTVQVTAEHGQVRLTGTVHSQHNRQLAAETALAAQGATGVHNLITFI